MFFKLYKWYQIAQSISYFAVSKSFLFRSAPFSALCYYQLLLGHLNNKLLNGKFLLHGWIAYLYQQIRTMKMIY